MTETPEAQPITPVEKIRSALTWYRVLAWMTGVWLIALTYKVVVDTWLNIQELPSWISIVHGWVYFAYLLAAFNLAVKVRWSIAKTVWILLAGTIPLLGIVVEQVQTREVKERFNL
jgi:integral membrane protein